MFKRNLILFWIISTVLLLIFQIGCDRKDVPIKIGFVGSLSGRFSDLGVAGRNGALLALEEWEQKGGLRGKPLELIVRDDKHDPVQAVEVDRELIEQGVIAIIGHMTSEMSISAYTLINEKKILMVSPTTSTPLLSGIDDYFIRVVGTSVDPPKRLSEYALQRGFKRVAVVWTDSNKAYCLPYVSIFREVLEKGGGSLSIDRPISKADDGAFDMVAMEILATRPDAVLLVLSATEAAVMAQQIRKLDIELPILSSGWALTPDLIIHGGKTVEGIVFAEFFNPAFKGEEKRKFDEKYKKRFGSTSTFPAIFGYDACNVILKALSTNPNPNSLKATILKIKNFQSPLGEFQIDKYGDAIRSFTMITVSHGDFVEISQ
ncbi:MAG: ABC transporter substrate-binding protein [Desulfatiglandales bacterium]